MQGFISGIVALKNEDIIVHIITQTRNLELYRFYGQRHSIINIGRKIDFEIEYEGVFMPKLRRVSQLGYSWESEHDKLYHWQQFLKILNAHLRDTDEIPDFYFNLLDCGALWLQKQNPARLLIELYARILEFEGRAKMQNTCFLCNKKLDDEISVARGFLCAHGTCMNSSTINKAHFFHLLEQKQSIFLSEYEVNYLLKIMLLGI